MVQTHLELSSPIAGGSFPELDWILEENRSILIFPNTLTIASSIYIYLSSKCAPGERTTRVRMYNSMNFDSHNEDTRELMTKTDIDEGCQIVIGTDTLSVGIDPAARQDAIIIEKAEDLDEFVQKMGRVGRNRKLVKDARVIVYISQSVRTDAEKALKQRDDPAAAKLHPPPDLSWAEMVVANCKDAALDRLYKNPRVDPICKCKTCTTDPPPKRRVRCNCSGCIPDILPAIIKPAAPPKPSASIPKNKRLTKLQKSHVWKEADVSLTSFLPPEAFFPSTLIKQILHIYVTLDSSAAISILLNSYKYLDNYHDRLHKLLIQLRPEFDKIAKDRKAELAAAKNPVASESDKEGSEDEEDGEEEREVVPTKKR
ncbi:hypothetical protein B0H11DRAFT_2233495 [Mycena galericulata]|nr:hypothetical protein B0H11DRAFT_2233495 [Mycena galericulata]